MRVLILIMMIASSLMPCSYAAEDIYDILDTDSIEEAAPDSVRSLIGSVEDSMDFGDAVMKLAESGMRSLESIVADSFRGSISIFAVLILCAIASSLTESAGKGEKAVTLAGTAAIIALSVGNIDSLLGLGRSAVEEMNIFSKALLPVITAAGTASGTPTASGLRYMAVSFVSDVIITSFCEVMMPLTYAYIALSGAFAATGNDALKRLASMIKWVATSFLKFILSIYTAYMALSGVISGAADALTLKTVKMTVSNAVPIVGGIISDAADTVITGAKIAKNAVGVYGMICILAVSIMPFLRIGIQYLMFKVVGVFSGIACCRELSALIDDIAGGFALILGMVGASASMLLVSIFLSIANIGVT